MRILSRPKTDQSDRKSKSDSKEWLSEEFYSDSDLFFSDLVTEINKAQDSVVLESYIFSGQILTQRVLGALLKAQARGVKVRVLMDGVGSFPYLLTNPKELVGLEYRVFQPVPFGKEFYKYSQHTKQYFPTDFLQLFGSLNRRNHRKTCVIDNRIGFVGSQNISDVHIRDAVKEKHWIDFGVRVEGSCVESLVYAFDKAWRKSLTEKLMPLTHHEFRKMKKLSQYFMFNHTSRLRRKARRTFLNAINAAKDRIHIITPYFVPTNKLLNAFADAAQRGVDVRLIFPKKNDVFFMKWVMTAFYDLLLKHKVRVYEYQPFVLHAKASIIDTYCLVGTANLNTRSILHDLEVNYAMQTDKGKLELESTFTKCFRQSEEITSVAKVSWYQRVAGRIFLVLRYWI